MNQTKWIVITSINSPSEAVLKYSQLEGCELVVVGDLSTPKDWDNANLKVHYFSPTKQKELGFELVQELPWNSYMRKMIGYLYAIQHGAEIIIDTDDDNIPKKTWNLEWERVTSATKIDEIHNSWVNTYQIYGIGDSWPRGYPLTLITQSNKSRVKTINAFKKIGIIQGMADGEPDFDAIYRFTHKHHVNFDKRKNALLLAKKSMTPINSQNTYFIKEFFPLLYLPSTVTFRSTDIVRGYVAQAILWNFDHHLAVTGAGVVQKRNVHNYLTDFESEIPIYLHAEKIANIAMSKVNSSLSVGDNMVAIYTALLEEKVVQDSEIKRLKVWLNDLAKLGFD